MSALTVSGATLRRRTVVVEVPGALHRVLVLERKWLGSGRSLESRVAKPFVVGLSRQRVKSGAANLDVFWSVRHKRDA